MHAPTLIDVVFAFLLLVVASIFEYVYFWPRFRADTAVPATILHALIDAGGGSVGYLLLRDYPTVDAASPAGSVGNTEALANSASL